MKIFFILFISSFLSCSAFADNEGKVNRIVGKGFVIRDKKPIPLKKGDFVHAGEEVVTEKGSFVQLKISSKGTLNIGPKSRLVVTKMPKKETKILKLLQGQVRATFHGKKSKKHKLIVNTKSASMGVRGTDFHIVYNDVNNITSTISFEGDVELSSKYSMSKANSGEMFGEDKVFIKQGQFSGVYTPDGYVNEPVRFSPTQWAALKKNTEIRLENKVAKKPKEKINLKKLDEKKNNFTNDISRHNEKEPGLPADLLGDTHRDVQKEDVKLFRPKPGGYIDLKTAIYVSPPAGSRYDPKEDLYYPPEEYGSVNLLTGEYIPPYGLVLLPLNGFVMASAKLQEGVKMVRENVTKVGKFFYEGAKDTTGALYDGAKYIGNGLRENTGVVGETIGKGVDLVTDGVTGTVGYATDTLSNATGKTLNLLADNMNTYLYEGFLQKVGKVFRSTPILNAFQLRFFNDFSWNSAQRFYVYDQLEEVVNVPTFKNQMKFLGAYKKFLSKSIFIRPKFNIQKVNHLRDDFKELRSLDHYAFKYGVDFGILKKFDKFTLQTYFFVYRANLYRMTNVEPFHDGDYNKYLKDTIYGFSKVIVGNSFLSSRIDYSYTKFESDYFSKGDVHKIFLSEIIKLDKRNYLNLDLKWSKQDKDEISDVDKNYGFDIKYHRYIPFHGLKAMGVFGMNFNKLGAERSFRGTEKTTKAGVVFSKVFGEFFSTQFNYEIHDIASDNNEIDNRAHLIGTKLNVVF